MAARGPFRGLREIWFATAWHRWRLGRGGPAMIRVPQSDGWLGIADRGRAILDGQLPVYARRLDLAEDPFAARIEDPFLAAHLHGFAWLRDLRALGGEAARHRGRALIAAWIARHRTWHPFAWRADLLACRIAALLGHFDYFCETADDAFGEAVVDSLARQAHHLDIDWLSAAPGIARATAASGRVLAAVAFEGNGPRLAVAIAALTHEITAQVHPDGCHASRAPAHQLALLRLLIDCRDALRAGEVAEPEALTDAVARMAATLRLMRHPDGGLALFNRSTEESASPIDGVLVKSESRRRAPPQAPDGGFQRLSAGRTTLIVDGGMPSPMDGAAHAGLLAFEMSVGKERLVVNCGSSPGDDRWEVALRATAAHSTLVIDDRNAAEIGADGSCGGRPKRVNVTRHEEDGRVWIDAEHDGYVPTHGLLHRRRLYLAEGGADLRGEDTLVYAGAPGIPAREATVRFHLHPKIRASVLPKRQAVLLRLASGTGWRLRSDSAIAVNESVYFGDNGAIQRCEQVVLTAPLDAIRRDGSVAVRWALQREDARSG
jgi:uncharacterized heparinase superfamily protein